MRKTSRSKWMSGLVRGALAVASMMPAWQEVRGQTEKQEPATGDLTQVSIENLMNIEVTSASKKGQKLSRVAAAIFVISKEDIRHSGATNIPDLLRMVPGVNVAQINANTWAISVRGFNEQFSDKLLVMIDGRSVYTPTFGGVYWDAVDLPLEDIERIEVVRGPGGTVWGANAVNGVINVITKPASETRGGLLVGGGGNLNQVLGTAQYGGGLGKKSEYRAYFSYDQFSHSPGLGGGPGSDGWNLARSGFRLDSKLSETDTLVTEGDLYGGREGQLEIGFTPGVVTKGEGDFGGGYLAGTWSHRYAGGETTLRASFDRYQHSVAFRDDRNTVDVEFKHQFTWTERQGVVWAVDYRFTNHDSNGPIVSYDPSDTTRQQVSGFVQDEIAVVPDRLYFTIGTKVEHNDYNGFDVLPSARVAWQPSPTDTFWAAVSRAERTPSSGDVADHVQFGEIPGPGGVSIKVVLNGTPGFQNEKLLAFEGGYRAELAKTFSMDLSMYLHRYNDLRTLETGALTADPTPTPGFTLPLFFGNEMHGEAHGLEVSGNWKPASRWTLKSGYAFERVHMHRNAGSTDTTLFSVAEGGSAHHAVQLQSHVELGRGMTWDTSVYYAGRLTALGVPTYTRVDTGMAWRLGKEVTLSVVGQNLVRDHQLEYINISGLTQSALVKRSAYAKLEWHWR